MRRATRLALRRWRGHARALSELHGSAEQCFARARTEVWTWNTRRKLSQALRNFVGSVLSPMRAKVFLPHVRDDWCVKDVQPRMQGRCVRTRCADECSVGCAGEADARRVMEVVPQRCARVRRTMHPENTGGSAFKRPPSRHQSAGGTGTVDVLGFPHYWGKTRPGYGVIKRTTSGKRLRRCMKESWPGCRDTRQAPRHEPHRM
jgi:RNA-directed DNA polymerase